MILKLKIKVEEKQDNSQQVKEKKTAFKAVRDNIVGGKWIAKNLNFFLFVSVLAIVYIANGHMADRAIRDISKTQKEIKELQYEYKTIKSEVMFKSEEVQVLKAAEPLGLKISKEVPQRLVSEK
ncbi:FtsL-like putative cell division protein [Parasediminibacterium paludis]|uniref:FtsL-like putative cell division protein n=1 Tax=Parasediminibacterium paludis TaxID=908966 RepID=A0ABV8PWI1_9BACT